MRNRPLLRDGILPFIVTLASAMVGCTGDDAALCTGAACTTAGATGGNATNGSTAAPGFEIAETATATVIQGATVDIELSITRTAFDGPVTLTATGLPAGTAASALVLGAGATSGKITLSALANVPQGSRTITIAGADDAGTLRRERPASLLVRGPSGGLDTSFGAAGRVTTKVGVTGIAVRALTVQTDGRILVAGQSENDVVVARLALDGSADPTYGAQGKVTADLVVNGASSYDSAEGIAIGPDGAAIVAGWTTNPSSNYALARFSAKGALDTTFATSGYVVTPFVPQPTWQGDVLALAVVVQPDGKPVFAGEILESGAQHHPVIARFKTSGALDDTFGTNQSGWFSQQAYVGANPTASSDDACAAVALAPGDKIVGAGTSTLGGRRMFVVRLDSGGKLDPSFGSGGFAQVPFPKDAYAESVHVLPDARVLVTGTSDGKIVVARLDAGGLLDSAFGGTGKVVVDVGAAVADMSARSVLDASGGIVVAAAVGPDGDVVLARVLQTGVVDAAFGIGGHVVAKLGAKGNASNVRIGLEPDGRIVAATNLDEVSPELVAFRFWP